MSYKEVVNYFLCISDVSYSWLTSPFYADYTAYMILCEACSEWTELHQIIKDNNLKSV